VTSPSARSFCGNARKIDGKKVPHYQMLLGGGYDETGVMRFGLQIMSRRRGTLRSP
jgi:hypothetical protein